MKKVLDTDLYCITAEAFSCGRDNVSVVAEMIGAGVRVIQYREKEKSLKEKYEECVAIRRLTREAGVTFIVNDHVGLAMMVGADGIHVGQDDLPVPEIRKLVGDKMVIGLSTHSPEQAHAAVEAGADYIGVGPVFRTYTKKDVCDPVGFEYLDYVVANLDIPFVAIGGIKLGNVAEVVRRGAGCVCMVTEIVGAESIGGVIEQVKTTINRGV